MIKTFVKRYHQQIQRCLQESFWWFLASFSFNKILCFVGDHKINRHLWPCILLVSDAHLDWADFNGLVVSKYVYCIVYPEQANLLKTYKAKEDETKKLILCPLYLVPRGMVA